MDIEIENINFEDLEERFQISTKVSFESNIAEEFNGLNPFLIEIKKKKTEIEKPKIENVELRKPKSNRNSLF